MMSRVLRTYGLQCHENNTIFMYDFIANGLTRSSFRELQASILQPVIAGFGLIINALFLTIILKTPNMRTVTNAYLASLSISDTIFLAIQASYSFIAWWLSPFEADVAFTKSGGCLFETFFIKITFFLSIFIVSVVSFDRYLAICRPLQHRIISGKSRTTKLIVACFITAAASAIPIVYLESNFEYYCWERPDHLKDMPLVFGTCRPPRGKTHLARQLKLYAQLVPFSVCFAGKIIVFFTVTPCL